MENIRKNEVLQVGKVLLDKPEYKKYCYEYGQIEKYISGLKTDTQVGILLKNIANYD
jgi:hypothetical protein